jgi:hypothetical protein
MHEAHWSVPRAGSQQMLHTAAHPVSGLQAEVHPAVFLTQARHWAALKLVSQQTLQTPVAVHFPSVPGAQAVPPSLPFTAGLRQLSRKPCVACSKSNVLRHPTIVVAKGPRRLQP